MIPDYYKVRKERNKKMKKVKIVTITLVVLMITLVAFVGVYTKVQNRMENQVKDYAFAMDLEGSRNIRLKVNQETETIIKDAEGNEVEDSENLTDEELAEKGYVKEEIPNNSEEIKTIENYQVSKKIIEKRLEKLGVNGYITRLEEETGDMVIELPENDGTDQVISNLSMMGKFEIIDSQTKEVLMTNSDIKQAKVMYGSGNSTNTTNSGTTVYLDIEFNKEGAKKLEEISSKYVKVDEPVSENEENQTEENETEEQKITMNIDGSEIMSTSFEEPIRIGKLQLSIGSASTDKETLQGYIDQAASMATVLDTGNMPVKYDISAESNQYILSDITKNETQIAIYVILAIIVIGLIFLVIQYKKVGLLGVISYIGFISTLSIVLRYANVVIALEGLVGIVMALILNYILVKKLLKNQEKLGEAYKDFFIKIIPIMILVITFSFMKWTAISSFGMTMFWAIVLMALYNVIITNSLLKIEAKKGK